MKEIKVLGIDLAKNNFSLCALSEDHEIIFRKSMDRAELIEFTANLKPTLIGFEACGGAHYFGRLFKSQGHTPKMMSVMAVKPFCPVNKKNDAVDAEAIAVAALQPSVRSVRIKSTNDQDLDMIKNLRNQYVKQRVALINEAHAACLECGVRMPRRKAIRVLREIILALEDANSSLTTFARKIVWRLLEDARALYEKVEQIEKELESILRENSSYKLLKSIPGVGLLTAAQVLASTGGSVEQFKNGRHFAAYLGLVPRQHSTGGKTKLRGITKTGPGELRKLLVVGTRSVLFRSSNKKDKVNEWITTKKTSKGFMKANVALANKTARIIYAVLKTQKPYRLNA